MDLVPGRECGECTVCCVDLNVDTPEFQKLPGVPCKHLCKSGGCGIYETRFPVCRSYHCAWRYIARLPDEWRPDKSGVLVNFQLEDLPAHYPKRPGVRFTLLRGVEKGLPSGFFDHVAGLVMKEVPIILAVPGPPGHFPAGAFMNDALKDAVARRDLDAVRAVFSGAFNGLSSHRFNPIIHRHAPGDGSRRDETVAKTGL